MVRVNVGCFRCLFFSFLRLRCEVKRLVEITNLILFSNLEAGFCFIQLDIGKNLAHTYIFLLFTLICLSI